MTRPVIMVTVLGLIAGVGRPASADDLVFGADGIPYLVARSSLIVLAGVVERRSGGRDARMASFEARVIGRLQGDIRLGETVTVALRPEAVDAIPPDIPRDSILFLSGPFRGEQARRRGIDAPDRPTYAVVGGRHGIWTPGAGFDLRSTSLVDYLEMGGGSGVRWARKYLESHDPYLQRSALLEVSYLVAEEPEVIVLLGDALRSRRVTPTNKALAVHSLEASHSPEAVGPLRELAESPDTPRSLRAAALEAIGSLPGGREELRRPRSRP